MGLYLFTVVDSVHAASNRTIDDTNGDSVTGNLPGYGSSVGIGWNHGPPCSACLLKPDADQLFMGTWHDNTLDSGVAGYNSITLNFTGTLP